MKTHQYKKQSIKLTSGSTIVLKQQIGVGAYSSVYSTSEPGFVAKLINSLHETAQKTYIQEKSAYSLIGKHPNIIYMKECLETVIKGQSQSVLLLENCPRGSLIDIISLIPIHELTEIQIVKVVSDVAKALNHLHNLQPPIYHRDIKMENVLLGNDGNYKLCDMGSYTQQLIVSISQNQRDAISEDIEQNTTPFYLSPEQADLYSGMPIGQKVDIFALGVIIYMLCYKKPPFESKLAAINNHQFIPDVPVYSEDLKYLMEMMFQQKPTERASSYDILKYIGQQYPNCDSQGKIDESLFQQENQKQVKPSFFMKMKKYFTRMTTQSEGWIVSAIEQNEFGPKQKYVQFLITKAWEQRNQVDKFYGLLQTQITANINNTIVTMKILILLHHYFKQGPPEGISSINNRQLAPIEMIQVIHSHWKDITAKNTLSSKDQQRSKFSSYIITGYSFILMEQLQVCVSYCNFFEGNFSLDPFFSNISQNFRPLTPQLLDDLFEYLQKLVAFNDQLLQQFCLWNIQTSLVLAVADQQYCLICLLTHLLHAFQQSTNFLNPKIETSKLNNKLNLYDKKFAESFRSVHQFFLQCSTIRDPNMPVPEVMPVLSLDVIDFIKSVPTLKNIQKEFNVYQFLNYNQSIEGIKIPQSYGKAIQSANIKNSNQQPQQYQSYVQSNNKNQGESSGQQIEQSSDSYQTTSNSNSHGTTNQYDMGAFVDRGRGQSLKSGLKTIQQQRGSNLYECQQRINEQENQEGASPKQRNQSALNKVETLDPETVRQNNEILQKKINFNNTNINNNSNQYRTEAINNNNNSNNSQSQPVLYNQNFTIAPPKQNNNNHQNNNHLINGFNAPPNAQNNKSSVHTEDLLGLDNNPKSPELEQKKQDPFWEFSHQNLNKDFHYNNQSRPDQNEINKVMNVNFFDHGFGDFSAPNNQVITNNINANNSMTSSSVFNAFNFKEVTQNPTFPPNNNSYMNVPPVNSQINPLISNQIKPKRHPNPLIMFSDQEDDVEEEQKLPVYKEQNFQMMDHHSNPYNNSLPVYQQMNLINNSTNSINVMPNNLNNNTPTRANPPQIFNNNNNNLNNSGNIFSISQQPLLKNNNTSNGQQNYPNPIQNPGINNNYPNNNQNNLNNNSLGNKMTTGNNSYQNLNTSNLVSMDYSKEYSGINNNNNNNNSSVLNQTNQSVYSNMYSGVDTSNQGYSVTQNNSIQNPQFKNNLTNNVNNNNNNNISSQENNQKFTDQENDDYQIDDDISEITIHESQIQMKKIKPTFNLNQNTQQSVTPVVSKAPTTPNQQDKQKINNSFSVNAQMELKQFMLGEVSKSASEWIIDLSSLTLEQVIGTGNSSEVYKGSWRGTDVAIKKMKIKDMNSHHIKEFQREITALIQVRPHQNLVSLVGVSQSETDLYIITEFCSGGTLFDLLHRRKHHFISWEKRLKICKDIAQGMYYLHTADPPIIHRDLKSLNLLLDDTFEGKNEKILIKIADFGLARVQNELMTGVLGTFHWMAPQIFESKPYTTKADVYSFGIVIWEICSRETPYRALSNPHAIMKFVTIDKGRPNLNSVQLDCPNKLQELMISCWDQDPNQRPDFSEVLNILKQIEAQ